MAPSMNSSAPRSGTPADSDPFDLDIRIIESSDEFAVLINLTDDGCGSSCPSACATNVG